MTDGGSRIHGQVSSLIGYLFLSVSILWLGLGGLNMSMGYQEMSETDFAYTIVYLSSITVAVSIITVYRGAVTDGMCQLVLSIAILFSHISSLLEVDYDVKTYYVVWFIVLPLAVMMVKRCWAVLVPLFIAILSSLFSVFLTGDDAQFAMRIGYVLSGLLLLLYSASSMVFLATGDRRYLLKRLVGSPRAFVQGRHLLIVVLPVLMAIALGCSVIFEHGDNTALIPVCMIICSAMLIVPSVLASVNGLVLMGGTGIILSVKLFIDVYAFLSSGVMGYGLEGVFAAVLLMIAVMAFLRRMFISGICVLLISMVEAVDATGMSLDALVIAGVVCCAILEIFAAYNLVMLEFERSGQLAFDL